MNWTPYIPALPIVFLALFVLFLKINGGRMARTQEEVEDFFLRMASGEVDDAGWDRFLNIPIKDRRLDSLRKRCEVLWEYDEFLTQNEDGDLILNDRGINELRGLIGELRSIQS